MHEDITIDHDIRHNPRRSMFPLRCRADGGDHRNQVRGMMRHFCRGAWLFPGCLSKER
jgi:hypothetical protein